MSACTSGVSVNHQPAEERGWIDDAQKGVVGLARSAERRARDRKIAGSIPDKSDGRIFPRINLFLC